MKGLSQLARLSRSGVLCLVGALLLSSCISARFTEGKPLRQERIADIKPGETTKLEVLDWFGAPTGFSDSTPLETMLGDYELEPEDVFDLPFADALVFRFTRSRLRATYLVFYVSAEFRTEDETLVVFFDDQDRVTYYGYTGALPDERGSKDD